MKQFEQGTPEWLAMRKNFIGASDIPVLMNESPYKTPHMLWQEKLGLSPEQKMTESMRFGKENEKQVRIIYEDLTRNCFYPKVVFHPKIPYLMASLDGIDTMGESIIEIKCNNSDNHKTTKEGRCPPLHYGQLQAQLECTGLHKMDYISFHLGDLVILKVERDQDYIDKMLKKCEEFWQCVINLEEPALVDADFRPRGSDWHRIASMLWDIEKDVREKQKLATELKEELKQLSEGQNSKSGEYRFVGTSRRGSINYEAIPELENVDLEQYRKPNTKSWSLKKS